MSDERPPLRMVEPMDPDEEPRGCFALWGSLGLAAYAVLILGLLCLGLFGLFGSSAMMVLSQAGSGSQMVSGVEADVWRLKELRGVGILDAADTPTVYHDHSPRADGRSGCMVVGDALVSWEEWAPLARVTIPGSSLEVSGPEDAPTLTLRGDGGEAICPFGSDEGGDQLVRMLRAELRKTEQP